jgi:methionine-rich copper-binding protein CopC
VNRQTGMRRMARIGTVVALAAGLASSFAAAAMAQMATGTATTHTTLTAESSEIGGRTVTILSATVLGEDGTPATGALALTDAKLGSNHTLAGAALDAQGKAEIKLNGLTAGDHQLRALYLGDDTHAASQSEVVAIAADAPPANGFGLGISTAVLPASGQPAIAPGDASTPVTVTITPGSSFTGFISLSCSGPPTATSLPVGVTCTFTPLNLQVTAPTATNPTGVVTADLTIQTAAPQLITSVPKAVGGTGGPLVLAVLLPGVVGLGFLGRKRKLFSRAALLLVIGAVSLMATTGCSARYRYLHHGPTFGGTQAGSYTIEVIAQTSDGVTASSQSQPLVLTVK